MTDIKLPFITLLLLISFASVNAVLFTPALPAIAQFFSISDGEAQQTISLFLIGYAMGQLIYGPIANRFGRKPALYTGILLQIISSLLCVLAIHLHSYFLLINARFLLALGSGVGLKMTFTLVNETKSPKKASQLLSYLMIAFAITPGLGVMIGGLLTEHFYWTSTFYAGAVYGVILLVLVSQLPETKLHLDMNALQLKELVHGYVMPFKNKELVTCGLLMGCSTSFVYLFAALAPFIAMNELHVSSSTYGAMNLLPPLGLITGSFLSAKFIQRFSIFTTMRIGILMALCFSVSMGVLTMFLSSALLILFVPMMLCYVGLAMIYSNASTVAMSTIQDKAHGSAVMSFLNMGLVTVFVLSIAKIQTTLWLLPSLFILISIIMFILSVFIRRWIADIR